MTTLTAEMISRTLTTNRLGRPTLAFERVGSTNDIAHEQARAGAGDGLLVIAEEQLAGRGRLDRSWWAPTGSCLLMSLLLRPSISGGLLPLHRAGQLTMCLGLGAVEGIAEVTGVEARLKWPNDLVIGGRKLGGMLTELNAKEDRLNYAVLGLGLNVNVDFAAPGAPPELAALATSLLAESRAPVDRPALLAAVLLRTEWWYERVLSGESPHEAWSQKLDTLGRRVRVTLMGRLLEGAAVGVTPEGGLLVRDDQGTVEPVWSGDVVTLR
jgi:BirA family transcriptional regulator, biotin operon repressor / biotin---[acetyl-CoA-carboxylase] ligase